MEDSNGVLLKRTVNHENPEQTWSFYNHDDASNAFEIPNLTLKLPASDLDHTYEFAIPVRFYCEENASSIRVFVWSLRKSKWVLVEWKERYHRSRIQRRVTGCSERRCVLHDGR